MLKFLGSNRVSDHPLADPNRLEESLRALPADPGKAIAEVISWLETIRTHEGFSPAQRVEAVLAIDAAAQIPARKLARELDGARGNKFQVQRILGTLRVYWRETAEALTSPIEMLARGVKGADAAKRDLPILTARGLRAWAHLAKWLALQYTALEEAGWARAYLVYALAEQHQIANRSVQPYARVPAETTAQRELLRLIVFAGSVPNALDTHSMLILDRVVALFAPQFELLAAAQPGTHHYIDLARPCAPARVTTRSADPAYRYVSGIAAVAAVETLVGELMVTNAVPATLGLDDRCDATDLVRILHHFGSQWAAVVPGRRAQRRKMEVRLAVTWGFDGLIDALVSLPAVGQMLDFSSASPVETWVTEEIGAGGFDAVTPRFNQDRLVIGSLIAAQAEGASDWQVGVVRRIENRGEAGAAVAVEVLARAPIAAELKVRVGENMRESPEVAILLSDPRSEPAVNLLLRAGMNSAADCYLLSLDGAALVLTPDQLLHRGSDYELLRCRVVAQS